MGRSESDLMIDGRLGSLVDQGGFLTDQIIPCEKTSAIGKTAITIFFFFLHMSRLFGSVRTYLPSVFGGVLSFAVLVLFSHGCVCVLSNPPRQSYVNIVTLREKYARKCFLMVHFFRAIALIDRTNKSNWVN